MGWWVDGWVGKVGNVALTGRARERERRRETRVGGWDLRKGGRDRVRICMDGWTVGYLRRCFVRASLSGAR